MKSIIEKPSQEKQTRTIKIMFHGCSHEYQDKAYGSHKRVFNKTKIGWRCTVCGGSVSD